MPSEIPWKAAPYKRRARRKTCYDRELPCFQPSPMANPPTGWYPLPPQYPPYYQFPPSGMNTRPRSHSYPPPPRPPAPVPPPTAPPYYRTFAQQPFPQPRRHTVSHPQWRPEGNAHIPRPLTPHLDYRRLFNPPLPPQPQIHILLTGNSTTPLLVFDLSAPVVSPRRRINPTQAIPLTALEIDQSATYPELQHLRIVCDAIPQWTLDLHITGRSIYPPRPDRAAIPYITVGDILHALHSHLHQDVTRDEWARLLPEQELDVSRAFTRRYKSSGAARRAQSDGVKRVDFLLRRYYFKGFVWLCPENRIGRMNLLVSSEP